MNKFNFTKDWEQLITFCDKKDYESAENLIENLYKSRKRLDLTRKILISFYWELETRTARERMGA